MKVTYRPWPSRISSWPRSYEIAIDGVPRGEIIGRKKNGFESRHYIIKIDGNRVGSAFSIRMAKALAERAAQKAG